MIHSTTGTVFTNSLIQETWSCGTITGWFCLDLGTQFDKWIFDNSDSISCPLLFAAILHYELSTAVFMNNILGMSTKGYCKIDVVIYAELFM